MRITSAYASLRAAEHMLAEHGVHWYEAEEALINATSVRRARTVRHGQKRYMALGRTDAGRRLVVVFAVEGSNTARVITAYDESR